MTRDNYSQITHPGFWFNFAIYKLDLHKYQGHRYKKLGQNIKTGA